MATMHTSTIRDGIWDDRHVKALLRFARSPMQLIQQNPWHSWIGERGGLKAVYAWLAEYPFAHTHRRMIEVVLKTPEAVADVYADMLHMSRATFFNHLPGAIAAVAQALNQWVLESTTQTRAPSSATHALPTPLTALLGAEERLATLESLLGQADVRLLVLLGPGGIGKSRLAIALAQRSPAPACFVELSGVACASDVPAAIACALGCEDGTPATLKQTLGGGEFLLVLDNLEQVLAARSLVTELLLACPLLKIIATSRVALHLYGEHEFVVPALATARALPAAVQNGAALSAAAELFVERAQSVRAGFAPSPENRAAIEAICRYVEGNPLAIELAAFQTKYYAPRTILARLQQDALGFLGKGVKGMPVHQQGILATLEWSCNLLPPAAQDDLVALATLEGRFTLGDAEALLPGAGERVMTLVDHSLLRQEIEGDESFFEMATVVRQYARARGYSSTTV